MLLVIYTVRIAEGDYRAFGRNFGTAETVAAAVVCANKSRVPLRCVHILAAERLLSVSDGLMTEVRGCV